MFLQYIGKSDVKLSGNLSGRSLLGQVMVLALWPFIQNLMATIVGFIDMMIAGRMVPGSVEELPADVDVASAMIEMMGPIIYIMWIMIILQASIANGAQALVARANGAKNRELAERAYGQSLLLGFIAGVITGSVVFLLKDFIITTANISENASILANQYIKFIVLSAPLSGSFLVSSSCLRASGDTLRPFFAMCFVNIINAAVSLLLVYGPGEIGGHGAKGIAIGTVVGWLSGLVIIHLMVRAKKRDYTVDDPMVLKIAFLRFESGLARRILKIALPNTFELLGMCLIHITGFIFIADIGLKYFETHGGITEGVVVGAHAIAIRVESFSFMPAFALGMASATLAGQYLGADSKLMAKRAVRFCCVIAITTMCTTGVIMYIFAEPIVRLLDVQGSEQGEIAVDIVRIFAFTQPLFAVTMIMKMSMRGAGATKTVMKVSYSSMIFVRLILLGIYVQREDATIQGAWLLMQLDMVIQAILCTYLHFKGKWLDAKV